MFSKKSLLAMSFCLMFSLSGCGGDDERIAYQFEGNAVPALEKVLTAETGGVYVTSLSPVEGGGEITEPVPEESSEESSAEETTTTTAEEGTGHYLAFDYQLFEHGQTSVAVKNYVELLTNDEHTFELDYPEEPDYNKASGTIVLKRYAVWTDESGNAVLIADKEAEEQAEREAAMSEEARKALEEQRKAEEKAAKEAEKAKEKAEKEAKKEAEKNMTKEEKEAAKEKEKAEEEAQKALEKEREALPLYSTFVINEYKWLIVQIDWTPTSCLITLSTEYVPEGTTGGLISTDKLISFTGAELLMHSIVPAEIGLPGTNMTEYTMKPGPGFVMVDDTPCLTMYIYDKTDQYTNELVATCFISADGASLYKQTEEGSRAVEKVVLGDIPDPLPSEGEELHQMAVEQTQKQAAEQAEQNDSQPDTQAAQQAADDAS